jgi:16S rRNA (adenine1518-N6/adenine1519-N6)-dimethyltransferase
VPRDGASPPCIGHEPMSAIDTLPPLRQVIATHGLSARKALGQNFLLDLNLTAKIARVGGDLSARTCSRSAPAPAGSPAGCLAEGARRVVAVEKDARCLPALAEIAAGLPRAARGDPRRRARPRLGGASFPPIRIVANLPYNVGTELLVRWLTPDTWPPLWSSMTLMFQREVAERIVAQPGSKAYGRLAILAQWRCDGASP